MHPKVIKHRVELSDEEFDEPSIKKKMEKKRWNRTETETKIPKTETLKRTG